MLRSHHAKVVLRITLLVTGLVISGCEGRDPPRIQNVILLSIDTLRRDSLRVYSEDAPALPNLDALAARSVVFANAHSTAAWTLPAHASMLTGLYPDRHGATAPSRRLRGDVPTMAETLRTAGLGAIGLTDGGYMHQSFGFNRGFSRYDQWGAGGVARRLQRSLPRGGARDPRPGSVLFDRAIAFLETRRPEDPPFFLFLQTFSVHDYFLLHPWALKRLGIEKPDDVDRYRRIADGREQGSAEDWDLMRRLYQAELEHLDEAFGRLQEVLVRMRYDRKTLIVLVSDHGEGFDTEHGRIHHGGRLHEDLVRAPMLFAGPKIEPRRVETPVSLVDLLPTLAELLGQESPTGLDGISLAPLIRGQELVADRVLYAMEHHHDWQAGSRTAEEEARPDPLQMAVLQGPWWYIDHVDGGTEFYRMSDDPLQRSPVEDPGGVGESLKQLAAERRQNRSESEDREIDPEVEEQLEALGYGRR